MRSPWLILVLACSSPPKPSPVSPPSSSSVCRYEVNCDCTGAPGYPARWDAALCMYRNGTDDLANDAVSACMAAPLPADVARGPDCAQNRYYQGELCKAMKRDPGCGEIPAFIEHGVGG